MAYAGVRWAHFSNRSIVRKTTLIPFWWSTNRLKKLFYVSLSRPIKQTLAIANTGFWQRGHLKYLRLSITSASDQFRKVNKRPICLAYTKHASLIRASATNAQGVLFWHFGIFVNF